MGSPIYRERYLAALEVAHSDLNQIVEQFDMLQLRKEQLEEALDALDPFLRSAPRASYEARQSESIHLEPVKVEREKEIVQPVLHMEAPEPVTPAAFSPMPEPILDPIQNRINRALGLAVA
ncbi:MAG: hypothetical protein WA815_15545 [Terracidiphilus sp.]